MISICITNYNREKYLLESFEKVLNDERIDEIVISDDHSNIEIYERLEKRFSEEKYSKVRMFRNDKNIGALKNKVICASLAKNPWIIVLDSDNIIDVDYLDAITSVEVLDDATIYVPEQARTFGRIENSSFLDYRQFCGYTLDKIGFKENMSHPMWYTIFNTGNYLVNRERYLTAFSLEPTLIEPYSLDVVYINYLMFNNLSETKIHVLKNMRYMHRIHTGKDDEESSLYEKGHHTIGIETYLKSQTSKW